MTSSQLGFVSCTRHHAYCALEVLAYPARPSKISTKRMYHISFRLQMHELGILGRSNALERLHYSSQGQIAPFRF